MVRWSIPPIYFLALFVASTIARRSFPVGGLVLLFLLPLHGFLPQFGLVSFGMRWYLDPQAYLFTALPGILGMCAARLITKARNP